MSLVAVRKVPVSLAPTRYVPTGQRPEDALVWDDFDRPNASILGNALTGQGWVLDAGSWGITGSKAYNITASGEVRVRLDSGRSDGKLSGRLRTASTRPPTGIKSTLLIFRRKDDDNLFQVGITVGPTSENDKFEVGKRVAGSWSTIAAVYMPLSLGTDYQVECHYQGSKIKAFLNGVERMSLSDTDLNTERGVGLRCYNSAADTTARWDNVEVRPL